MEIKLLVELIIIVVALFAVIFWLATNYLHVSTNLFDFLNNIPQFAQGG